MSSEQVFALTSHVCRYCLGRVLQRVSIDGERSARCADCGASAGQVDAICMCNALPAGSPVRLVCAPNSDPTPDAPSEIVAVPVERAAKVAATPGAVHGYFVDLGSQQ